MSIIKNTTTIFNVLFDDLKILFLTFLDSRTKQNLFIYFNDDFYHCYFSILVSKIKYTMKPTQLDKSKFLLTNNVSSDIETIFYFTQNASCENLLLELQSLLFKKKPVLFNKFDHLIYQYYLCKLSNPFINVVYKNNNESQSVFNLITIEKFKWIINNKINNNLFKKTHFKLSEYYVYKEGFDKCNKYNNYELNINNDEQIPKRDFRKHLLYNTCYCTIYYFIYK